MAHIQATRAFAAQLRATQLQNMPRKYILDL